MTKILTTFVETHYSFHVSANGFSNVCTVTWDGNHYRVSVLGANKIGKMNHKTMQDAIWEALGFCGSNPVDQNNLTIDLTRQFLNLGEHDAVGKLKKI